MGFSDRSLLCKIVFILLILCFVIDLIGFAIPFWFAQEETVSGVIIKTYVGLWEYCTEAGSFKACTKPRSLPDWFQTVRVFSTLSWLFFLAALIIVIVFVFFMSDKKVLYLVAVCMSFAGAFCAMIAFAVYAGKSIKYVKDYSASFALTVVAFILGLIIGILGILDCLGVVGRK